MNDTFYSIQWKKILTLKLFLLYKVKITLKLVLVKLKISSKDDTIQSIENYVITNITHVTKDFIIF